MEEAPSRIGNLRNRRDGEIVEVQGGHIVRSTGRKDRHSKVCTAKGPRDRRVRLSAHTAIQFYDVQDRLGYDRPSKAVDWLIKKAKAAIDELEELPAWKPTTGPIISEENPNQLQQNQLHGVGSSSNAHHHQQNENNNSSFLPPSMHSDSIADTIKSFFPMGASTQTNSSASPSDIQFHQQFQQADLLSRTSSQSQDLRLSLQSFQDPMLLNHQNEQAADPFSGTPQMGFDGPGWSENQASEMGRFQRMVSWNAGGDTGPAGGGAFVFNSPPPAQPMLQPLFGQTHQLFSQRGPLQSSNTPSVRAWIDPSAFSHDPHHHQASFHSHPSSVAGIGFASGGGFSGFRIPARIQGEEEEHDGISDKPSSASSDSRH